MGICNFTYKEVTYSDTAIRLGIDNSVSGGKIDNVFRSLCGIQAVRNILNVPIKINSWYRCDELNKAVGGAVNSAHKAGLAVDFVPIGMTIEEAYNTLIHSLAEFDQLLLEKNSKGAVWIHISFDKRNRKDYKVLEVK